MKADDMYFLSEIEKQKLEKELENILKSRNDINTNKVKEFLWCMIIVQKIMKGKQLSFDYDLFGVTRNSGHIGVCGSELCCKDPKLFRRVSEMSTNFEVFPKTNGTVQINFTFYELGKKV